MIVEKKKEYEAEYQKAIKELQRLEILVKHLEGAILACDELLKLQKDKEQELSKKEN